MLRLGINEKMLAKRIRVSRADAIDYLSTTPLFELGRAAHDVKRRLHGTRATFIVNLHINPTNLCVYSCKFCDYAAKPGDTHAYSLEEGDILRSVDDPALQEVHIVGGLWPKWGLDRSLELVRRIRTARPDLWIKAFTAVEVVYFAHMIRSDDVTVLKAMRDAGVDAMPGGGAEVLSERVRTELFPDKCGPDEWLAVHASAHAIGLPTNATLLFGHIETDAEIADHLLKLRALQDKTQGFQSFIPLAYQPGSTRLVSRLVSAPRCLRVIAAARLVLDNIPHIKAYWPTLGVETASAALSFGADDLDGTLGHERIMQLAGSASPAQATVEFMERLIRDGGQSPVQRKGNFDLLPGLAVCAADSGSTC